MFRNLFDSFFVSVSIFALVAGILAIAAGCSYDSSGLLAGGLVTSIGFGLFLGMRALDNTEEKV